MPQVATSILAFGSEHSFRRYEFDDCPNTEIELADMSQHSHTNVEWEEKARQLVSRTRGKEEANDETKDMDNAVSEDHRDGRVSELDGCLCLQLLSNNDPTLFLPTDCLEDEEIHIIDASLSGSVDNRHALQDYQKQLMMLEQRNRERLLQAKRDNDALGGSSTTSGSVSDGVSGSTILPANPR